MILVAWVTWMTLVARVAWMTLVAFVAWVALVPWVALVALVAMAIVAIESMCLVGTSYGGVPLGEEIPFQLHLHLLKAL
jgi:hypothetical protein